MQEGGDGRSRSKGQPTDASASGYTQSDRPAPGGNGTEPTVSTERMLTALEQGVKGGLWYSHHLADAFFAARGCDA